MFLLHLLTANIAKTILSTSALFAYHGHLWTSGGEPGMIVEYSRSLRGSVD